MTNCPDHSQLEALLADRLSSTEEERLESHVLECERCQTALEELTAGMSTPAKGTTKCKTRAGGFIPVAQPVMGLPEVESDTSLPRLKGYEIYAELGRGGMGVVYRARHVMLNRMVALKMLLGGARANADQQLRFLTEAEAIARVTHPNIVQIFDIGRSDGEAYLALEFVDGGSLSQRVAGKPQPPREAAALVETIARAIQVAHENGIIHRDLKPGNVLLSDGRKSANARGANDSPPPLSELTPKVTDFGLAKMLDRGLDLTGSKDVLGTPSYMAPEQIQATEAGIGPAADIYALGAVLYALLTGRPPFDASSPYDTMFQVLRDETVPPSRLVPTVPRDVETICLKCLQKEPGQRYASAAAMADDLRRFLNGEPILARPTSLVQRGIKWARRRPVAAGALGAMAILILFTFISLSVAVTQARRSTNLEIARRTIAEEKQKQDAELLDKETMLRRRAEEFSARSQLDLGINQCEAGELASGLHTLVHVLELAQKQEDADLEYAARVNLSGWTPSYFGPPRKLANALKDRGQVRAVAFSPDGRRAATGTDDHLVDPGAPPADHSVRLWDTATAQQVLKATLKHTTGLYAVTFSPDGTLVLTGSRGEARLWNASTGNMVGGPLKHPGIVESVAFEPTGRTFLTRTSNQVQLWDTSSRQPIGKPIRSRKINSACFSPDGKVVLTASDDGSAGLWNSANGEPMGAALSHPGPVTAAAFSPDGQRVLTGFLFAAAGQAPAGAGIWQLDTRQHQARWWMHDGPIMEVAFSPNGRFAATAGAVRASAGSLKERGQVRLWRAAIDDREQGEQFGPTLEHPAPVHCLAFSPSGHTVMTGCKDAYLRLWKAGSGQLIAVSSIRHPGNITQAVYSSDGRKILTGLWNEGRLWDAPPELPYLRLTKLGTTSWFKNIVAVAVTPDGRIGLMASPDGSILFMDLVAGRFVEPSLQLPTRMSTVVLAPDGRTLVSAAHLPTPNSEIRLWDLATRQPSRAPIPLSHPVHTISVRAGGQQILIADGMGRVHLRDISAGKELWSVEYFTNKYINDFTDPRKRPDHEETVHLCADDRHFVVSRPDGMIKVGDVTTGRVVRSWQLQGRTVPAQLSADGRTCLVGDWTGEVRLLDVETGKVRPTPHVSIEGGYSVAFHPDGRSFLTGSADGKVRRWDLALGKPLGPAIKGDSEVIQFAFAGDSSVLFRGREKYTVGYCRGFSPVEGEIAHIRLTVEVLTGKMREADGTLRALADSEVRARRLELDRRGGSPFDRRAH